LTIKCDEDYLYEDNVWFKCAFSIPYLKLSDAGYGCSQFIRFPLSPQAIWWHSVVYIFVW